MTVYILGAGPAGLSLAYYLSKINVSVEVFEATDCLGGMARTWTWNDFHVETGPHLLHTPLKEIWDDWKSILGDNLIQKEFFSANYLRKVNSEFLFDYPLNKAQVYNSDYWSDNQASQIVDDLACRPDLNALSSATSFDEYVQGLVGPVLSSSFYKNYPEKVWGIPTTEMLPDWAPKRLRICEGQESFFNDQFSGISKYGSGFLFQSIAKFIRSSGNHVRLNSPVIKLSANDKRITEIITTNSSHAVSDGDLIVSTIPVTLLANMLGLSYSLDFRGIASVYLSFESPISALPDPYSWLYFSDSSIFNRVTEPTKISSYMNQSPNPNRKYVVCEHAFSSNLVSDVSSFKHEVLSRTLDDFKSVPIFSHIDVMDSSINVEKYVYPVQSHKNILTNREICSSILCYQNIELLGTSANYAYNDMQVIFKQSKEIASDIQNGFINGSLLMSKFSKLCDSSPSFKSDTQTSLTLIAEIGINHNGDFNRLLSLAKQATSVAEIVKLQFFKSSVRLGDQVREVNHVEKAQDTDESIADVLKRCELSLEQLLEIRTIVESSGKQFMSTVFSIDDAKVLLASGLNNFKLASMDLNNYQLHKWFASISTPLNIYISTGMSTSEEVDACLNIYKDTSHSVSLLACTSSYPSPDSSLNLSSISHFISKYPDIKVGYSDHSVGTNASFVSISKGATVIELHFTDDTRIPGPDQLISKNIDDFNAILEFHDFYLSANGWDHKAIHPAEYFTWKTQRKSLYALQDIAAGDEITYSNTSLKSPPLGISPVILESQPIFARIPIPQGSPITEYFLSCDE